MVAYELLLFYFLQMATEYNIKNVSRFWSNRLKSTDPLAAVLTYNAPDCLNQIYDQWERLSLLAALDDNLSDKKCLDLACGIGRLSLTLASEEADVTAVDLSSKMLAHLKDEAIKQKLETQMQTVKSAVHELQLPEQSFDIITCFGLLEHLPPTIRTKSMKTARRLLKPNGRIYLVINNIESVFLQNNKRVDKSPKGYYNHLVGLSWLENFCAKNKMKSKILSANPHYAHLHYHQLAYSEILFPDDKSLKQQAEQALKLDMLNLLPDSLRDKMASHYMIELRPTR